MGVVSLARLQVAFCFAHLRADLRARSPLLSQVALTLNKCLMSFRCLEGIRIKRPSRPPAPLGARRCEARVEPQMSHCPLRGDRRRPRAQHPCIPAPPCHSEQCCLMMTGSCGMNKPSVKALGDSKNLCAKRQRICDVFTL